jgi:hypothetical protein
VLIVQALGTERLTQEQCFDRLKTALQIGLTVLESVMRKAAKNFSKFFLTFPRESR